MLIYFRQVVYMTLLSLEIMVKLYLGENGASASVGEPMSIGNIKPQFKMEEKE